MIIKLSCGGVNVSEKVYFKPKARLMSQLGEQLIKNESIALLELVKNAYDADAKNVFIEMNNIDNSESGVIIIEDDGDGMDIHTVKNVWMEIGTDSKRKKLDRLIKKNERSPLGRLPMGEKGIGRFGVHKLGNKIELITKMNEATEILVSIDWRIFDSFDYLSEVPITIVERKPEYFTGNSKGTKITISDLKVEWSRGKLRDVYRSINSLNSPFKSANSFKINFKTNLDDWLDGLISYDEIKEYALFEAQIRISGNQIDKYIYEFKPWEFMTKLDARTNIRENIPMVNEVRIAGKKNIVPIDLSNHNIGSIKMRLLIFDLESSILSQGDSDKKGLKDYLRMNGGIRIRHHEF